MADSHPTIGELFKAKAVTDEQVNAVSAALLATMREAADVSCSYVSEEPIYDGRFQLDGYFDIAALARAAICAMRGRPSPHEKSPEVEAPGRCVDGC